MEMNENFIRCYNHILPLEAIQDLTQLIDDRPVWYPRSKADVKDKQLCLDQFYPDMANQVAEVLLKQCLDEYIKEFPQLVAPYVQWATGTTILQKTDPGEGYHRWHCEKTGLFNNRDIAWMIYLNDVEEGGETEFLYQHLKVNPKKNMAVLWPGAWTHMHRGNPPISGSKFILTGWFVFSDDWQQRIFNP